MNILEILNKQRALFIITAMLLLSFVGTSLLPAFVSAATVSQRSIALTNSSVGATAVTYKVGFKAVAAAEAFVIEFCSNTPVLGQACTAPTGMVATAASSATVGFTGVTSPVANKVVVVGTIGIGDDVLVELDNITNSTVAAPIYARIFTYASDTHANGHTSINPSAGGAVVDSGSVVISITNTIGVSGAVHESLLFCVSGAAIEADCAGTTSPVLVLGETVGSTKALVASALSTGNVYTQITTNAASGAVVRLKSNAVGCGGLLRAGAPDACDIEPALVGGIIAGQSRFGVMASTATDTPLVGASGVLQPVTGSGYNITTYALNFASDEETGVTSLYGDPFLDTDDEPANNKNMQLTFAASVSNQTPGGSYSANLSMIATGKF